MSFCKLSLIFFQNAENKLTTKNKLTAENKLTTSIFSK